MKNTAKLIVTTSWDDGQKVDVKLAELLTRYSIKGTFYITRFYRDPLEKHDVMEIDREHEIGAHTLSHVDLLEVPFYEARKEIEGSKAYIQGSLGHAIKMFCYPYGRYNKVIKKVVEDAGFIAARTCKPGDFDMPKDPYEWQITLHASDSSPLMTLKIWWIDFTSIKTLIDWEIRAKTLFDLALKKGGVYHLWGHGSEFEEKNEWDKLQRVFEYISNVEDVQYMTNGEVFTAGVSHARKAKSYQVLVKNI